jgi:PAS domain S-box-containing protein
MKAKVTLNRLSEVSAGAALALGAVNLGGWLLRLEWFRAEGGQAIMPMGPNSALFLLACGAAVILQRPAAPRRAILAGRGLGLLVFVFSAAALVEAATGLNTAIAHLIIHEESGPMRVPLNTTLPFCLAGLALWALGRERQSWFTLHRWLGWGVVSYVLLSLVSLVLVPQIPLRASHFSILGLALLGGALIGSNLETPLGSVLRGRHVLGLPALWLALVGLLVPLALYAGTVWILRPQVLQLHDLLILLAICYSLAIQGTFTLALRRMDALDRQRREAEGARDALLARLQHQAASLEIQVAERTNRLKETSERLQLALRSSNFGVWDWDVATNRLVWDNRQLEIYGLTPVEFDGRRELWSECIHPADRARMLLLEQQVIENANVYSYSFRILRRDGAVRHIEAHGFVQRDASGRALRVIGINRDITSEREHAQAVDALNLRLQFVLNATGYGVWEYDTARRLILWDDHMLQIYGRSRPQFNGSADEWRQMVHPEDRAAITAELRKLVKGTISRVHFPCRILRPDGTVRWVESQGYAMRRPDGWAERLVGLTNDITETRELRENLRITEERWRLALSSSNDGVWDWNLATGEVYRDARCLDMVGRAAGELPTDRHLWQSIGHPDDAPATNTIMAEYLAGRLPIYQSEYRVRHKAGHWVWMLARGKIVERDATGRAVRMVGTKTDITPRKELEERLRHGEELSLQLGRLAQIGAWEWNLTTRRVTWSPEMFRIHEVDLGYEPTQEKSLEFYPPQARQTMAEALDHAIRHGTGFDLELPFQTARGHQLWVRVLGRAELREGTPALVYGAFQDITNRRDAEDTRRKLEGQLFQAQKMETLGTLAGGIAHDFNNLLTGILGYQDLALDSLPEGDQARGYLSASREASMRARELVEQILTFSRQAGSEKVPVNLGQVVEDARRFLRATVPSTIRIEVEIAPECGRVQADATQIHQVLLNLGSNSAHAMRATGGTMRLTLRPADLTDPQDAEAAHVTPGHYLELDFGDTGHGMDEEVRKRIFDPFFTTKEVGQGTGLGLSVVHGIIQAHHGAISVRSAPGQGCTFVILLPVAETERDDLAPAVTGMPRGSGELIAVVDDEDIVRSFAQMALEKIGYRVASFDSATQCLEVLRRSHMDYALLLTDQTMPVMKGLELAAEVRAVAPTLPVVIMSGYFSRITPDKLAQIGQVALLSKPFTNEELARTVHGVLHPEAPAPAAG